MNRKNARKRLGGPHNKPIAGGVYTRLNLQPLTDVFQHELRNFSPRVTIPVTFSGLPSYIDRIWAVAQTNNRHFSNHHIYSKDNQAVFTKGALMLAEAKIHAHSYHKPEYSIQQLFMLKCIANMLPLPLAIYLECLGQTEDNTQEVTPTLAKHPDNADWSAALSWAPKQLPPLLKLLLEGISVDSPDYACRCWLDGLPKIEWEEYSIPPEGTRMAKLTEDSFNFWTENVGTVEAPDYDLRWTSQEQCLFQDIIRSLGFIAPNVTTDLSHSKGSRAQFIQTSEWQTASHTKQVMNIWFVNTNVEDYSIKLGAAFRFGNAAQFMNDSRFTGCPAISHKRGELSPWHIIGCILNDWQLQHYTSDIQLNPQWRLEAVSRMPLHKYSPPVTVPVTFSALPCYINEIWTQLRLSCSTPGFKSIDSEDSKAVFTKGALMLAEAKINYAQVKSDLPPEFFLPSRYSGEELRERNYMADRLPLPLALYLECLGNTNDHSQDVTPILAEHPDNALWSAALSWAPKQLPPLLNLLRKGVPVDSPDYAARGWLHGLPKIEWEEYSIPPEGTRMAKLTEDSFNFWTENVGTAEAPDYDLRWTLEEQSLFREIIMTFSCIVRNACTDLTRGEGSPAQFVQTPEWQLHESMDCFVNTKVDDHSMRLGAAFGFGKTAQIASNSRFTGSLETAYMEEDLSPSIIIYSILREWVKDFVYDSDNDSSD